MEPRYVPLEPSLLRMALAAGADPIMAKMTIAASFTERALGGPGWIALRGGHVLGAGGIVPWWPGRAEAWLVTTVFARPRDIAHGLEVARDFLAEAQRQPEFQRIEAWLRAGPDVAMGRALGLAREGRARAWWPGGDDAVLYARVRDGLPPGSAVDDDEGGI